MLKNVEVIMLDKEQLAEVLKEFSPSSKNAIRLVEYLNEKPKAQTLFVNQTCSILNISDVARKANRKLLKHGIQIACERPSYDIFNQFNEPSNQYLWSIFKPLEAANDDNYNQGSSIEAWEKELSEILPSLKLGGD